MGDADVTDMPAWPGGADGLHHRLLRADSLDHRVRTEPAREFLDPRHAIVPSLFDDVSGAELEGELLSRLVAAHGDDPSRAEAPCGQHGEQTDCAITDHGNGLAGAGLGGDGTEPAGAEHVGGGEETRDQLCRRYVGGGHEGAVGERNARQLRLRSDGAHELAVDARTLVAGLADLAGVVRGEERADHELTWLDLPDISADLLDDADVLVTHRGRALDGLDAPVGPQV